MGSTLIEHNPLLKQPILQILTLTEQNSDVLRSEIEDRVLPSFEGIHAFAQTPTTVVDILIRNKALAETIYVDGEAYMGSLQDIQTDADIDDEAEIEQYLTLTEIGSNLLDEYTGDKKLRQLFAEKPAQVEVFVKTLELCAAEEGCTLPSLEKALSVMPELAPDERGMQNIYPQYFIDALETAGAIEWQGSWHITDAGRAVMQ